MAEDSRRQSENCIKMKRNKKRFGSVTHFCVHLLINDEQLSLRSDDKMEVVTVADGGTNTKLQQ